MSVAVAVKVSDGFAIAADSATTLATDQGDVVNIYNSANKAINLVKGLPIGMMFWDAGSIGALSMITLAKDLRQLLTVGSPDDPTWKIDPDAYTMDEVAAKVKRYFYDTRYQAIYDPAGPGPFPSIGMYVCGFGSTDDVGREFEITIQQDGTCTGPNEITPGRPWNLLAFASPDPIFRLIVGMSLEAAEVFNERGMSDDEVAALIEALNQRLYSGLVHPAMPIQDALELAEFLVHLTVMYYRFRPGHNTVGGPIEVAAITKHEGFKWVSRKFYYERSLNP
jgi:hypothetical protein